MNFRVGAWRIKIEKLLPAAGELAKMYDSTKWYWNSAIHRLNFGRAYRSLFQRLREEGKLMNIRHGSKILDVGIGAGLFTESLVKTIPARYKIFGIDISGKLLQTARENLSLLRSELCLKKGDARHLPFKAEEMDLVISGLTLEHSPEPFEAIREMTRVLRPGANLVIVVTLRYAPDFITRLFYRYTPLPAEKLKKWLEMSDLTNITSYRLSGAAGIFGRAYVGTKLSSDLKKKEKAV